MKWQPKTERCAFLVDNLDLEEAAGFPGARWEAFQLAFLDDDSIFRIDTKARQIAFSFLLAADAVATGILRGEGSLFVSINLEEAKEKIRYAKQIIGALPTRMQPKLLTDNRTELEFGNGARLISLPSTAQRGKAQMHVALDEYAHVRDDARIYTAVLPIVSKGNRRLRIGSSPMGASGRFWEIATEGLRKYPGYQRKTTPWWEVQAFCLNVREARRMAPALTTFQRVEMFGNDRIKAIYANMPEEDFQQEYECVFVDESTAWITWEEIKDAQDAALVCLLATCKDREISAATDAIDAAVEAIDKFQIERVLVGGLDIGRTRNATELFFVGLNHQLGSLPLRLAITLEGMDFDHQRDVVAYALDKLPIAGLLIDQNGIGRNLAETLEKLYPGKVAGVDFTNPSKLLWATDAKTLIQQRKTPLPVDRDIAYQIHSIKKMVTGSKNLVFDTDRNEKHHADKFWAWALALATARVIRTEPETRVLVHEEDVQISAY